MMQFKVHEEDILLRRIVRDLTRLDYSVSYNLVVPPCFGEERLARAACDLLRREHADTPLAVIAMDEVRDAEEFVRRLHAAWSTAVGIDLQANAASPSDGLQRLFGALSERSPAVIVIRRFHKILDTIPPALLGALRTAEQQRKVRALVLSPVSHRVLKSRWHRERPLVVSDYGDSHTIEVVWPPAEAEFLQRCAELKVPSPAARWFLRATGGYPELADEMVGWWHRNQPRPAELYGRATPAEVVRRAERFVKWLDAGAAGTLRRHVLHLFHGVDRAAARDALARHEWGEILLHADVLRAHAIGEAAVQCELHELADGPVDMLEKLACMAYRARNYVVARQVYGRLVARTTAPGVRLSLAHATIMDALYTDADAYMGPSWTAVLTAVEAARATAAAMEHRGGLRELGERYDLLYAAARTAQRVREWHAVDELSRPLPDGTYDPGRVETTLLLLALGGERIHSCGAHDTTALIDLMQQVFRVWARWRMQLDARAVPPDYAGVWPDLCERLPHGTTGLPEALAPGQPFVGFAALALFAMGVWAREPGPEPCPERGVDDMLRVLRDMGMVEIDAPSGKTDEADRFPRLVEVLERWMTATLAAAPAVIQPRTLEQLREVVRPLPPASIAGALDWDV